jgi:hypothetical protein
VTSSGAIVTGVSLDAVEGAVDSPTREIDNSGADNYAAQHIQVQNNEKYSQGIRFNKLAGQKAKKNESEGRLYSRQSARSLLKREKNDRKR